MLRWIRNKFNPEVGELIDEHDRSSEDVKRIEQELGEVRSRQKDIAVRLKSLRFEADIIARQHPEG